MVDQHNAGIPAIGNAVASDIPDIKENLEWHKDILQMLAGWKNATLGSVGPAPHRAVFAYSDADTITIGAGSYFHDGTTRQVVFWDAAITFDCASGGSNAASDDFGTSEWHYVYLDDTAIVTQGDSELDADCFLNDTTAPTFSTTKHGWYNGADKCIFAFYVDAAGNIEIFYHDGGDYVHFDAPILEAANIGGTAWTDQILAGMPGFSVKAQLWFWGDYIDATGSFSIRKNGSSDTGSGNNIDIVKVGVTDTRHQLIMFTDSSQTIEYKATVAVGSADFSIFTAGWFLPPTI